MLEVISEDYVKTAKAKGLSSARIVWSHQIRNAIIPMIPSLGMEIVTILMGSFVVEQILPSRVSARILSNRSRAWTTP